MAQDPISALLEQLGEQFGKKLGRAAAAALADPMKAIDEFGQTDEERKARKERQRALQVLGFDRDDNPTEDEVKAAHREAMKAAHPDAGGSEELARKINNARDLLLGGAS